MSRYILSAAQARSLDQALVARTGLPSLILMENAGRSVADVVREFLAQGPSVSRVVVVCGPGNNGGDGFVVARQLVAHPGEPPSVDVLLATPPSRLTGDAAVMFRAIQGFPEIQIHDLSEEMSRDVWLSHLRKSAVIVDAVFGTGLSRDVTGIPAIAISAINTHRELFGQSAGKGGGDPRTTTVISIDVPSGMDTDSGTSQSRASHEHHDALVVHADVTVTMATLKRGFRQPVGAPAGEIRVAGLGVPLMIPSEGGPYNHELDERAARAFLPRRAAVAHKGSAGHLVVVAGSAGKTGAAWLVGRAAMRSGAGLVTIATTGAGQIALDAKVIELMTACYASNAIAPSDGSGEDADESSEDLVTTLLARVRARALVVGPGIPVGRHMESLVRNLALKIVQPALFDADALNLLGATAAATLAVAAGPRVVTPHPGEMARLVGLSIDAVQSDRTSVARRFATDSRAVVVLKGAHTVIATPDGDVFVSDVAQPALATAGSGDVLSGIIGALLCQGLGPVEAAQAGVVLHAAAGSLAASEFGTSGVVSADLPDAVARVRSRWEDAT